jgi:peptide/nickel transport system ATP-binding protein
MALAHEPRLIIADEPTTALDVTVQAQILELLGRMKEDFQTAVILITHDLGVVADVADDVVIMYGGRPMEQADVEAAFIEPHHPYTQGLLQSIPSYGGRTGRLRPIKGYPPSLMRRIERCPFSSRCPYVRDECLKAPPPLKPVGSRPGHLSACILPADRVGLPDVPAAAGAPSSGSASP